MVQYRGQLVAVVKMRGFAKTRFVVRIKTEAPIRRGFFI